MMNPAKIRDQIECATEQEKAQFKQWVNHFLGSKLTKRKEFQKQNKTQTRKEAKMNEIVVFNEVIATIAEYKDKNESLAFDYRSDKGNKDARSHIAQLRKVKTKISDVHKIAKADALEFCRTLDGKKRELTGEVDEMITFHKEPLDVIAAEKQAKIDAEVKRYAEEQARKEEELAAREAAVQAEEERIAQTKAEEKRKEEEKAFALQRAEREKRIAEEAAERAKTEAEAKAKAEAEAKERARIEAEEKAEAEAKAKELAEIKRKEAEEAKEMKRIANKRHRQKIEGNIHCVLMELGTKESTATAIVSALKENKIPNVTINY